MQTANEDPVIQGFYNALCDHASDIVSHNGSYPPVIILLERTGMTYAGHTPHLNSDERASLLMELASDPRFSAVALVSESWYADNRHEGADVNQFVTLAQQGRLRDYAGRREAVVINIVTAARQAVMVCQIDRSTKTVQKAPFRWLDQASELILHGAYIRPAHAKPN
jgi:hypothetical protein